MHTPILEWIYLAQFGLGFGSGMAYPTLMGMSIEHVEGSARSTAMGLHQAVYALGMFGGPWLSGILANWIGIQAMFAVTAVMVILIGVIGVKGFKWEGRM
jgi:MFS family permease